MRTDLTKHLAPGGFQSGATLSKTPVIQARLWGVGSGDGIGIGRKRSQLVRAVT
jgi:hypothetical protein